MKLILCYIYLCAVLINSCKCYSSISSDQAKIKSAATDTVPPIKQYASTIILIDSISRDNTTWDALFNNKDFIGLYENSLIYIDSAIVFLKNPDFTISQKKICINSMQRASIENYIKICKSCKEYFDKNIIDEEILNWIISPNFSNRYLIIKSYNNPLVTKFLKSLKLDSKISNDFRKYIDTILSGEASRQTKDIYGLQD